MASKDVKEKPETKGNALMGGVEQTQSTLDTGKTTSRRLGSGHQPPPPPQQECKHVVVEDLGCQTHDRIDGPEKSYLGRLEKRDEQGKMTIAVEDKGGVQLPEHQGLVVIGGVDGVREEGAREILSPVNELQLTAGVVRACP